MSRQRAFTLVELLVVIAIVALLIAVLLPALKLAKRSADRIVCASNMRQLSTAFIMYTQEHRGWLPLSANWEYPLEEDWIHWQKDRDLGQSRILPYLGKSTKVLQCPSGSVQRPGAYQYSYAVNQFIAGTGWVRLASTGPCMRWFNTPCNLQKVVQPSHKLLLGELDSNTICDGTWDVDNLMRKNPEQRTVFHLLSVRHEQPQEHTSNPSGYRIGWGQVIFADGHYEMVERWRSLDRYHWDPAYAGLPTLRKSW